MTTSAQGNQRMNCTYSGEWTPLRPFETAGGPHKISGWNMVYATTPQRRADNIRATKNPTPSSIGRQGMASGMR